MARAARGASAAGLTEEPGWQRHSTARCSNERSAAHSAAHVLHTSAPLLLKTPWCVGAAAAAAVDDNEGAGAVGCSCCSNRPSAVTARAVVPSRAPSARSSAAAAAAAAAGGCR